MGVMINVAVYLKATGVELLFIGDIKLQVRLFIDEKGIALLRQYNFNDRRNGIGLFLLSAGGNRSSNQSCKKTKAVISIIFRIFIHSLNSLLT